MSLDLEQLGAFSFISFLKRTYLTIDQREYDLLKAFPHRGPLQGDWESVDEDHRALFDEMTDIERKNMIRRQVADLHESHHFHSLLLIPAGSILITLLMLRLRDCSALFDELRTRLQAGAEPFDEPVFLRPNKGLDSLLAYFLDGTLSQPIAAVNRTGAYPAGFAVKYDTGPKGALGPAVRFGEHTYRLGLRVVLEGWTEALIRALLFRARPREYYEWYLSTRDKTELWVYTLIDRVLIDIFGTAYSSLDPTEQYPLIAHICIGAGEVYHPDKYDFMEYQGNHPGWNLLQMFDFLWTSRTAFVKNNRLDVHHACRTVNRFRTVIHSIGCSSLLDQYIQVCNTSKQSPPDKSQLGFWFWHEFSYYQTKVMGIYLNHPEVFHNASEWLNCAQRDLLPRVPIMISSHTSDSQAKLNFPDERQIDFWFTWFMFSQLLETIIRGKPTCPIVLHDVEQTCPRDNTCDLLRLQGKGSACHLKQLLSTTRVPNKGDSAVKDSCI
jgi:hypothetical protein